MAIAFAAQALHRMPPGPSADAPLLSRNSVRGTIGLRTWAGMVW